MGNRSLDDFLGGDGSANSDEAQPANEPSDDESGDGGAVTEEGDDGDRTPESDGERDAVGGDDGDSPYVDPDEVEPAAATYVWNGNGGVCDACGERSGRRWRREDGLVCPDCKKW